MVKEVVRNMVERYGLDSSGSGQEPVAGFYEQCDEAAAFVKGGKVVGS
jgi:hypothetical protein